EKELEKQQYPYGVEEEAAEGEIPRDPFGVEDETVGGGIPRDPLGVEDGACGSEDPRDPHRVEGGTKASEYSRIPNRDEKLEEINRASCRDRLLDPFKVILNLALCKGVSEKNLKAALVDQYRVAVRYGRWGWVREMHKEALQLFSRNWIIENIPHQNPRYNTVPQKKAISCVETPAGLCRDVRLKSDKDLEVRRENAAEVTQQDEKMKDVRPKERGISQAIGSPSTS
ncbi:uncharacterized protein LOC144346392, partial [Saccoglossus kowalevskii]